VVTKGRSDRRIRSYVGVLVLVPILGVITLAAGTLKPKISAASHARDARNRVARLTTLVNLSTALGTIQLPLAAKLGASDTGITGPFLAIMIGFDPEQLQAKAEDEIRAVISAHQDDPLVRSTGIRFEKTLREITANPVSAEEVVARFRKIQSYIDMAWEQESKEAVAAEIEGSGELNIHLEVVRRSLKLGTTLQVQHETLFSLVVPEDRNLFDLRALMAALRAQEKSLLKELNELEARHPDRQFELNTFATSTQTKTLTKQIDSIISGVVLNLKTTGKDRISEAIKNGIGRSASINTFIFHALEDANQAAVQLEQKTNTVLWQTIGMALAILAITFLVAAKVSIAVTDPLRALASRARRVAAGHLDIEANADRGPHEVRVVGGVLDDLVSNLQRLQGQASAVATGSLDAAILTEKVPGPLGDSLSASVTRLVRSVRERDELQELLAQQATHDSLTGLPNRAAALLAVEQAMGRSKRRTDSLAVLFLDLDDFKRANDERGHAVGDIALQITAARILETVRTGDVVARLGGDEFLVVAEAIESLVAIRDLAERIVEAVSMPMDIEGGRVRVGASIGFAVPDSATENAGELLRRADLAMYQAKNNGRGRVVEFDDDLSRAMETRLDTEKAIALGLQTDQFRLHYQPIIDAKSGVMTSVEALLRWDRPGFGAQSPAHFIPLVEASPLIVDVGRWVLQRAAQEIQELRQRPEFADVCVAVNLSGRHLLNLGLVDDVSQALEAGGLPPSALTIEITETTLVTDLASIVEQTRALRALGVKVAIDDFGTGYTSIGQLSRLPVDTLKIDRAFVDQIATTSSRRIVELVIEVGHTLGMKVVAEGVEDAAQLAILQSLHCDYVQGYYFSEPMRLDINLDVSHVLVGQ
jgi:diguanylate cyclase (GGDEF)-like protein